MSVNGVPIRLTGEDLDNHIMFGHGREFKAGREQVAKWILETISSPDEWAEKSHRTGPQYTAVKRIRLIPPKWVCVHYQEPKTGDGWVITAHPTTNRRKLHKILGKEEA